ncbi:MAG: YraN family protein [Paramuribaculum sp.]|nr:YraN family protein [Paramuribaculum sp.]MDE6460402.1 YraN family protein [Paramuribaculum sp.]MDE6650883.1 YraN family protein [Paramuribaculum sp.]
MAEHNDIGAWGEEQARDFLVGKGYAILDTNVRFGKNELDIVARHHDRIVFVEVKTRTDDEYDPLDAIDSKKIAHLCRAAESYVTAYNIPQAVQFDVIVVIGEPGKEAAVTHYPDAFMPPLSRF